MDKFFRHGDLLIVKMNKLPKGGKKQKDNILALGEATGHSHRLAVKDRVVYDFENEVLEINGQKLPVAKGFNLQKETELKHEEHNTITLPVGDFVVIQEREFDYFSEEINRVID